MGGRGHGGVGAALTGARSESFESGGGDRLLALVNFDAPATTLLDELLAAGRLPALAAIRARASHVPLETPSTLLSAATYPTLWSGRGPAQHGLYYPFQWVAEQQRVRYQGELEHPELMWERFSRHGMTSVVVDAYESPAPDKIRGAYVSGWQFSNRVVLPRASRPTDALKLADVRLRRGPAVDEVFGQPTTRGLTGILRRLVEAPGRAVDLTLALLRLHDPGLVVLGLPAVHLAGHQLFDPAAVLGGSASSELRLGLSAVYVAADHALGRFVEALPAAADLIVVTPHGMGANASRAEALPAMIEAILDPAHGKQELERAQRIRSRLPVPLRAQIARALPARWALELASRISTPQHDWSRTRAFAVPSDTSGLVRVNLRGRERDGILDDRQAGEVLEELEAGLATFELPSGEPVVRGTRRVHDAVGPGRRVSMLPDLAVLWTDTPRPVGEVLTSPRFGALRVSGVGSGRSGNHDDDAWALVAPGSSALRAPTRASRVEDIAATVGAVLGVDEPGEPLLDRR